MPKKDEESVSLLDVLESELLVITERVALALGHLTQLDLTNPSPHIVEAVKLLKDVVADQCESRAEFAELMGLAITEAKKISGDPKTITH
jgi:hypothetical protein